MRVGGLKAWERAQELYDRAKLDLALATGSAAFAGLATLDAHYSWFWSGRQVAGFIAIALGSGAALLGVRAGARAIGAAAFAAIASAQYVLGAGARSSSADASTSERAASAP